MKLRTMLSILLTILFTGIAQAATVIDLDALTQVNGTDFATHYGGGIGTGNNVTFSGSAAITNGQVAGTTTYSAPDVYVAASKSAFAGNFGVSDNGGTGWRIRLNTVADGDAFYSDNLFAVNNISFSTANDTLDANEIFISDMAAISNMQARFVIKAGSSFYISEPSANFQTGSLDGNLTTDYSIEALSANWFDYDPTVNPTANGVADIGSAATPSFSDITFVGFHLEVTTYATGTIGPHSGCNAGVREFSATGFVPAAPILSIDASTDLTGTGFALHYGGGISNQLNVVFGPSGGGFPAITSGQVAGTTTNSAPDVYVAASKSETTGNFGVSDNGGSGWRIRLNNTVTDGGAFYSDNLFKVGDIAFDEENDTLDASEIYIGDMAAVSNMQARFVIKEGDSFYISEPSTNFQSGALDGNLTTDYSIEALSANWFDYDPTVNPTANGVADIGSAATPMFNAISFVGFHLEVTTYATGTIGTHSGCNAGVREFSAMGFVPDITHAQVVSIDATTDLDGTDFTLNYGGGIGTGLNVTFSGSAAITNGQVAGTTTYSAPDVYVAASKSAFTGSFGAGNDGAAGWRIRLNTVADGDAFFSDNLFAVSNASFSTVNDTLDASDIFISDMAAISNMQARFVIKAGSSFYISEPSTNFQSGSLDGNLTTDYSIEALSANWFDYDPTAAPAASGVADIGPYATPSFSDITFVGFHLEVTAYASGTIGTHGGCNAGVREFTAMGDVIGTDKLEYFTFNDVGSSFREFANLGSLGSVWNNGSDEDIKTDGLGNLVVSGQEGAIFRKLPDANTVNADPSVDEYATPFTTGAYRLEMDLSSWELDSAVGSTLTWAALTNNAGGVAAGIQLKVEDSTTGRLRLFHNDANARNFDFGLTNLTGIAAAIEFDFDAGTATYYTNGVQAATTFNNFTNASQVATIRFNTDSNWSSNSVVKIDEMGFAEYTPAPVPVLAVDFDQSQILAGIQHEYFDFALNLDGSAQATNGPSYNGQPIYAGLELDPVNGKTTGDDGGSYTNGGSISFGSSGGAKVQWNGPYPGSPGDDAGRYEEDDVATGVFMFKKEDFLNGLDSDFVAMHSSNDTLSATVRLQTRYDHGTYPLERLKSGKFRWVVQDAGSFYISAEVTNLTSDTGDVELTGDALDLSWFDYDPETSATSISTAASPTLQDIDALGFWMSATIKTNDGNRTYPNMQCSSFEAQAVQVIEKLEYFDFAGSGLSFNTFTNSGTLESVWNYGGPAGSFFTDGAGSLIVSNAVNTFRSLPDAGTANAHASLDQYAAPYTTGKYRLKIDFSSWDLDSAQAAAGTLGWDALSANGGTVIAGIRLSIPSTGVGRLSLLTDGTGAAQHWEHFDWTSTEGAHTAAIEFDFDNDTVDYFIDGSKTNSFTSFEGTQLGQLKCFANGTWSTNSVVKIDEMGLVLLDEGVVGDTPTSLWEDWLSDFSLGTSTGFLDHADSDDLDNLTEYAFGGDPADGGDQGNVPMQSQVADGGTNYIEYVYYARDDAADRGLAYLITTDTDLVNAPGWTNAFYEVTGTNTATGITGFNAVTNRMSTVPEDQRFLRLQIEFTP